MERPHQDGTLRLIRPYAGLSDMARKWKMRKARVGYFAMTRGVAPCFVVGGVGAYGPQEQWRILQAIEEVETRDHVTR